MTERRAIAYSLYGTQPRYLMGAVRNAQTAADYYPGWELHFWVGGEVPCSIVSTLKSHGAHIHAGPPAIINKMFWRFLIHDLPGIARYIVRDVDSRPSRREVKAVEEWIESGRQLHVMRDHPFHNQVMMGGMWGWFGPRYFDMNTKDFKATAANIKWGADQTFLLKHVWQQGPSKRVHDSCGTYDRLRNWPSDGEAFVGEYISENEQPNLEHRRIRREFLANAK